MVMNFDRGGDGDGFWEVVVMDVCLMVMVIFVGMVVVWFMREVVVVVMVVGLMVIVVVVMSFDGDGGDSGCLVYEGEAIQWREESE